MKDPFDYGCDSEDQLAKLWSDPMEAPEVPSETILRQFIEDEHSIEATLGDQLKSLPNCKRALAHLRAEMLLEEVMPVSTNEVLLPDLPTTTSNDSIEESIVGLESSLMPGAVCSLDSVIRHWRQNLLFEREIFSQELILVISEKENNGNEEIWQVAPCSLAITCPDELSSEADFKFSSPEGLEYVARLDLATEVLEKQISEILWVVETSPGSLAETASMSWDFEARLNIHRDDKHLTLEWRQTMAKRTLLDNGIKCYENMQSFFSNSGLNGVTRETQDEAFRICEEVVPHAMAAATDGIVRHRLTFMDDKPTGCHCELVGNAYADKKNVLKAEWEITDVPEKLVPGMPFFLVRKKEDEPCGHGLLHRSGDGLAAQLIGGEGAIASDLENSPDDFLLLCRPPSC